MAAPMVKSKALKGTKKRKKQGQFRKKERNSTPSIKPTRDSSQDVSVFNLKLKGAWTNVDIDYNLLNESELNEFCGLEELTDYELLRGPVSGVDITESENTKKGGKRKQQIEAKKVPKKKTKLQHQTSSDSESEKEIPEVLSTSGKIVPGSRTVVFEDDKTVVKSKKTKKTKKNKAKGHEKKTFSDDSDEPSSEEEETQRRNSDNTAKSKRKLKKEQKQPIRVLNQEDESMCSSQMTAVGSYTKGQFLPQREQALDMSAWEPLSVPSPVLQALQDMGFTKPSPIQTACIPAAIKYKDILGAAETGSGKTLAFGIPILHHILKLKEQHQRRYGDKPDIEDKEKDEEEDEDEEQNQDEISAKCNDSGGEEEELMEEDKEEEPKRKKVKKKSEASGGLLALILAPTRELAVQVRNHLVAAAKYTGIKIAVVVGGVSAEKQVRILKKKPEIVVGTPGRLWELVTQREPHLSTLAHVRYLVIDEADRMVERGHYIELGNIMDLLNGSHMVKKRQTLIFSATLTLIHIGPNIKRPTDNPNKKAKSKLDTVLSKVGVRANAKVVDLTSKQGTVASLLEAKIVCNLAEKDIYLYYLLLQYPERTIVFTNSIECIRRLISIFNLLECNPLPLHSSMPQRQRLKNLDRFAANPKGLLIATDVAARGLDIPNVQHVIHYHVPKTSESYVHRSGRTARMSKEGLSIMIVSGGEFKCFRRVCKSLNRNDLPNFPTDLKFYEAVAERVNLARDVDKLELSLTKKQKRNQWYENAAKEMDVDLDDRIINEVGKQEYDVKLHNARVRQMRGALKSKLKSNIFPRWSSQLYPTLDGSLVQPFASSGTGDAMSSLKTKIQKDKVEQDAKRDKKKRKFKKFKKYQKFAKKCTESSSQVLA